MSLARAGRLLSLGLVLGLLFMATAAPGGGGGAGGGGGGSGGGGARGGSVAGYGLSTGWVGTPWGAGVVVLGLGAAVGYGLWEGRARRRGGRLVEMLFLLPHGPAAVKRLDPLLSNAGATPSDRRRLAEGIPKAIRAGSVERAAGKVESLRGTPGDLARKAERRWACRLTQAGLQRVLGTPKRGGDRIRSADACVLGVVAAVDAGLDLDGVETDASGLIERLAENPGQVHALYFYYAPDPGQPLDPEAARALFDRLAAGTGRKRSGAGVRRGSRAGGGTPP